MRNQTATEDDQRVFLLQIFEMGAAFHFMFPAIICSPTGWVYLMAFYSDEEHAEAGSSPIGEPDSNTY